MTNNHLKEERATFNLKGIEALTPWQPEAKPAQYHAKIFKSGNSLALRLPKALGLKEGTEMILSIENGRYVLEPADAPKRKIDVSGFWGKAPGARLVPRGDFEERPSTIVRREAAKSQ